MNGHRRILQQRIQIVAVHRDRKNPIEGIRGEQDEQEKADADQSHHADDAPGQEFR